MDLPTNFYPVLHPADWPGKNHCLHRPLIGSGTCPLLVSYAIVEEASNQTLPAVALEGTGESIETIEERAVNNWLASFSDAPWETSTPAPGCSLVMARMESDAFSSGIVSHGLCKGMHRTLGADMIYLGVPDRFTIIASSESVQFTSVLAGMYNDAMASGLAPLSPTVFVSERGHLVGWAELEGQEPASAAHSGLTEIPANMILGMVAAATTMINVGEGDNEPRLDRWFGLIERHAESSAAGTARTVAMTFGENPEFYIKHIMDEVGDDPVSMLGVVQLGLQTAEQSCQARELEEYKALLLEVVRVIPNTPPSSSERGALEMHEMLILGEE